MKKIRIILTTLVLAACTQQEQFLPVDPATPDSDVLIVPRLNMGASGSGEATSRGTTGTRATTRATTCPYVIADATGKKTIVVLKDMNGGVGNASHPRWQQTPYHTHTTVVDGFNVSNSVSPYFEVAQTGTGLVEWGTADANCTAPWRRPTVAELEWIYKVHTQLELEEPFNTVGNLWYATATEYNSLKGWHTRFDSGNSSHTEKTNKLLVRCVRDAYPYVTTNAEGKASVIVARDEYGMAFGRLHAPWTVTPAHVETDPQNSVSYQFEVAQDDTGNKQGASLSNTTCTSPFRLPTEREMLLIVNLRDQLSGITSLKLSNTGTTPSTYWTFTKYSGDATHYWYTEQNTKVGTTDHAANTNSAYVRCVRDLNEDFPDAVGAEVAGMWAYTSTSSAQADLLITDTKIKRTATGFELSTSRYYPADGNKKLYFYAYAPAAATALFPETPTVLHEIDGKTDILWAKDDRGIAKSSNPAQQEQPFFRFRHQLMQLQFKFVADPSFVAGQKVTDITVKKTPTYMHTYVVSGGRAAITPGNISLKPTADNEVTSGNGTVLKETLMICEKTTVILSVTVGGVTYPDITVDLTGEGAGKPGTSHLITLTLKRNTIVPTASTAEWVTGTGSGVDVI